MKKNWKKFKLKDIKEFINRGITPKYTDKNGCFVLNQKCIRNGLISYKYARKTDNINKKITSEKYVKDTDILICSTGIGTLGRVGCFRNNYIPNTTVDSHITIVRVNKNVNYKFLSYNLFFRQNEIEGLAEGSTGQIELPRAKLGNLIINLPPLEIQNKIVKVLSAFDDKIELNNKINENLEQQAQAIFNKYFPSINVGNKLIGNYIKVKRGKNLLSKDAILGKVPVVAGGLQPATYHNKSNTGAPVITISASGANAGYINLWHIPVWSSDSSFIDNSVSTNIYFWFVLLKNRQQEIYDSQTGSAQPHIYPQHIENLHINDLDKKLVNEYNKIVTSLFKLIGKNKIENEQLTNLRDTLLPKLMNGEIDVENIK